MRPGRPNIFPFSGLWLVLECPLNSKSEVYVEQVTKVLLGEGGRWATNVLDRSEWGDEGHAASSFRPSGVLPSISGIHNPPCELATKYRN